MNTVNRFALLLAAASIAGTSAAQLDRTRIPDTYLQIANRNAASVQRLAAAIDGGNRDQFIDTLHLHHRMSSPHEPDVRTAGRLAAWESVSELRERLDGFHFTPQRVIAGRHFAAVVGPISGRHSRTLEGVPASGRAVSAHALYLAYMRNGEVRNSLTYFGEDELLASANIGPELAPTFVAPLEVITAPPPVLNSMGLKRLEPLSRRLVQARLSAIAGEKHVHNVVRKALVPSDIDAMEHSLSRVGQSLPDLALKLDDYFSAGEYTILVVSLRGTLTKVMGRMKKLGAAIRTKAVILVRSEEGGAVEMEIFMAEKPTRGLTED